MTLTELREQVSSQPVRPSRFYELDRLISYLDRTLIPQRGGDSLAPELLWNDDGVVMLQEGDTIRLFFGGRLEGWWMAMPKEPISSDRESEIAAGGGVPEVVLGG